MENLAGLQRGKSAIILDILASDLRPKLLEMGLIPGQSVQLLYKAPLGDPIAVQVGTYVLSLRLDEAALISVSTH